MYRFKPIPHWCISDVLPAFYDFESLTAIEQTGRLYKTIESLIKDYNNYADEMNTCMNDFLTGNSDDYECYKAKLTHIMHNYIAKIDEKIKMQDSSINKAIDFIKNDLEGTIQDVLISMKESGELSEVIMSTFEDFTSKLNEIDSKILGYDESINNVNTSINEMQETLNNFQDSVNTSVSELETSVSEFQTDVNNRIANNSDDIEDLKNIKIPTKVSDLEEYDKIAEKEYVNNALSPINTKINNIEENIDDINSDKTNIKNEITDIKNELNSIDLTNYYDKSDINSLVSYSTNETKIGIWIDGKPIYRKVLNIGNLPNTSIKTIDTGLIFNSSNCILKNLYGVASYEDGISFPLPYSSPNGIDYTVSLNIDNNNKVAVTTAQDRSTMTGYVVLEYTKTTD